MKEALMSEPNNNGKFITNGRFITKGWVAGVLVALVMGMGGYIFQGYDRGNATQTAAAADLNKRVADDLNDLRKRVTDLEQDRTLTKWQYLEIIKRLDRLDTVFYGPDGRRREPAK